MCGKREWFPPERRAERERERHRHRQPPEPPAQRATAPPYAEVPPASNPHSARNRPGGGGGHPDDPWEHAVHHGVAAMQQGWSNLTHNFENALRDFGHGGGSGENSAARSPNRP